MLAQLSDGDRTRRERLEKLRFWRRACAEGSERVRRYNESAPGTPLIFFHGDFDMGGTYLTRLASATGYPLVALAPLGLQGDPLQPSIGWMAEQGLAEIRRVQPSGPYRLGGYCNGALVAYEAAQRLVAAGETVEVIVLLEPAAFNTRPFFRGLHRALSLALSDEARLGRAMIAAWSLARILRLARIAPVGLAEQAGRQVMARLRHRQRGRGPAADNERRIAETAARLKRVYLAASAAYLPPPTAVPLAVLSTERDGSGRRCGLYEGHLWQAMARDFRFEALPGHHSTCLSDHLRPLAAKLSAILGENPARP